MNQRNSTRAGVHLLSSQDVADLLGVSVRTLWRLVASGQFPHPVRFNRKLVRWRSVDVDAYLEEVLVVVQYKPAAMLKQDIA